MRTRNLMTLLALLLTATLSWSAGAAVLAEDETIEPVVEVKEGVFVISGDEDGASWTTDDGETIVMKSGNLVCGDGEDGHKVVVQYCGEPGEGHKLLHLGEPVKRTWLGVAMSGLTPELQVHFGASEGTGVMVSKVMEESPAEAAGIQVGDVIVSINGVAADSLGAAQKAVREMAEGDTALVEMVRNGSPVSVEAVLGTREFPGHDQFHFDFDFDFGDLPELEDMHKCIIKLRSGENDFVFQTESLEEAMEKLHEHMDSPEFKALLEKHEAAGADLEKRLEELEQRLQEIEEE
jgi:hypothetical protein